jgi:hypothetical protein
MSDTIFDSFINSVYSGGGSMELFDSEIEVVGGADDITVESIFGGLSESMDEEHEESINDEQDKPVLGEEHAEQDGSILGGLDESFNIEYDSIDGGDSVDKGRDDSIVSSMNISLNLSEPIDDTADNMIVSSMNIPIDLGEEKKDDDLSASDVASLLGKFM